MELVERDAALDVLAGRLRIANGGGGQIVLIAGEAGIGKTSLLNVLGDRRGDAQLWWGECIALQTPHPLAPLHDIARSADAAFRSLLRANASRAELFEAILSELENAPRLVVIEDVHWADDATLDFLTFIGRHIGDLPCLLALSYRDDEVGPAHPFRRVLGDLPAHLVTHVDVERLSASAVDELARRAFRSPAGVYAVTHGNPFFTSELLRHGRDGVPKSVTDLVLARFSRLQPQAQRVVQLAAMVPAKIERQLIEHILACDVADIEACLNSGLLVAGESTLSFRHELARVSIEASVSAPLARSLHGRILAELIREDAALPAARYVHHAVRAGDAAAVRRYAPAAALQAQQSDAHREAAAHFRTALDCGAGASEPERTDWLDRYARECALNGALDEAITARLELAERHRQSGNRRAEASNLSALALDYVVALRTSEADEASRSAIEMLEARPPSVELGAAYRTEGHLRMLNRDCADAIAWSTKAIELADRFSDQPLLAAARGTLGTALLFVDYEAGRAQLQRVRDDALAAKQHTIAATVMFNLGSASGEVFRFREARRDLEDAVAFAERYQIDASWAYGSAWLALCDMYLGRWDDARSRATAVLERTSTRGISRIMALVALGRLAVRCGDAGSDALLDDARELAGASDTLQRIAPVCAMRAEAAWIRGDRDAVIREAQPALARAIAHHHPWFTGELAFWLHRAGALDRTPSVCAEPFALQIAGRHREAAAAWAEIGCPFEEARALAEGTGDERRQAAVLFERLGLSEAGVRRVPRKPRASTQANALQLTARELEVLQLLCEGLKNAAIAERLCRSVRTIDHHVAATFAKLGVSTRAEAVSAAARAGIRGRI